jgi:hypothetical protein
VQLRDQSVQSARTVAQLALPRAPAASSGGEVEGGWEQRLTAVHDEVRGQRGRRVERQRERGAEREREGGTVRERSRETESV